MRKWIFLLRGFFPSWRFFDDVGPELKLEVRAAPDDEKLADKPWINCLPPIPRSLRNIFLNPKGNYLHACHNHLNLLNADIVESEEIDTAALVESATYKITKNMALHQITVMNIATSPFVFQFRLSAAYSEDSQKEADEILISPIYGG